jgi:CRISPR-associated endonuclease Csn1
METRGILDELGNLQFAFDVGHSSIGWAVLRRAAPPPALPEILGTGVVIFGADDCLAVKRRQYRQARRHARATRQRIVRMEQLLAHLGVMTTEELAERHDQAGGDSFAWQRAAALLAAARTGQPLPATTWPELWDILRWYAHNRGYFAPPWADRSEEDALDDDEVPDTEKVANAGELMRERHTTTMAETIAAYTAWYDREVARWQQGQRPDKPRHFKGRSAAFDRVSVVWPEVRALLTALKGTLPKLDDTLIRTLLGNDVDPLKDRDAWRTIPCPAIRLPKRYHGGLLFGQSIPRFDNRIIGVCPIQFARLEQQYREAGMAPDDARRRAEKESKLPTKASPEFLRFRWAMQLANVVGAALGVRESHPLPAAARVRLTELAARQGAFTKGEFKKAVREAAGWPEKGGRDNLDALLLHPDAEEALVFDPVQAALRKHPLADALLALPPQCLKRLRGKLARGKEVKPEAVRDWLGEAQAPRLQPTAPPPSASDPLAAFDAAVQRVLDAANTRKGRKQSALTRDQLLDEPLRANYPKGRAPYARPVLRQAYEEVMKGWDPRAEQNDLQPRGCLCQTDELKEAQLHRRLAEQTNNHLIRHRLLILGGEPPKANAKPEQERRRFKGLLHDLVQEFANGDQSRIAGLTIEVNRELRDLSGKDREAQKKELGAKLGDFKRVAAKVEEACRRRGIPCTAGLIRKARVAEDLGWKCPYTGKEFSVDTLLDGVMDKEHIIPHSDRQSDSLDSLVITWKEINLWKGKRTAMEFIRDEGGKAVPGLRGVEIMSLAEFQKHVASLDTRKGHDDDRARKKRRVRRLLTEHYEEKEFTPRDLTVTSHLVRLGAQVLQRAYPPGQRPRVISLPGSVTGEVRKAWKLIGCLGAANPAIFEADGKTPKRKDDIRGITHLHHALDACVLGLASLYFPRHGAVWSAMVKAGGDPEADDDRRLWLAMTKRRPSTAEAALLKATGLYQPDSEGRLHLNDLPDALKQQIRQRLAEKRVVQHIPADMSGVKVEENTRGVVAVKDGRVVLRQRSGRDAKTGLQVVKTTDEAPGKLLGLNPPGGDGKLKRQKGVRVITDNFGVAILDHAPEGEEKFVVIPWHRVWHRLNELKARNGGEAPRVLRNGQVVSITSGTYAGRWRVFSIKAKQAGIKVNLGTLDCLGVEEDYLDPATGKKRTRTVAGCKLDAALPTMVKGGLKVLKPRFCGTP